jgi:two-component system cell cycle response regulator DivK
VAKILLVEDHPDSRDLIRFVLEIDDHTIVEASTGEEGLKLATQFAPDLILLDISLAGEIDGMETARRLRREATSAQTVIFALTAHAMKNDEEMILAAGFDKYFTKPIVDFEIFRAEINKALLNGRVDRAETIS